MDGPHGHADLCPSPGALPLCARALASMPLGHHASVEGTRRIGNSVAPAAPGQQSCGSRRCCFDGSERRHSTHCSKSCAILLLLKARASANNRCWKIAAAEGEHQLPPSCTEGERSREWIGKR
jgi:hypothetical protein